jgi:Holliday junction resolvasome RuvABC endonuclease subunit
MSIDPALVNTGVVIFEWSSAHKRWLVLSHRLITTEKDKRKRSSVTEDKIRRCRFILDELSRSVKDYKPQVILAEYPSGGAKDEAAATALAMATCLLAAVSSISGLPIRGMSAREVKKQSTGDPGASKETVAAFVAARWPELANMYRSARTHSGWVNKFEHISDACAVLMAAEKSGLIEVVRNLSVIQDDDLVI